MPVYPILTYAWWVVFHTFVVVCWLFFKIHFFHCPLIWLFFKFIFFSYNSFRNTFWVSISLYPDRNQLVRNCLQRLLPPARNSVNPDRLTSVCKYMYMYEGWSESSRKSAIKSHCFYRLQWKFIDINYHSKQIDWNWNLENVTSDV